MLTNFRVGDRVEDKETHKRGCVTFVFSKLEFRGEFIEVLFDGRVDNELELGRLQDRQVGRLGAFEDLAGVEGARSSPLTLGNSVTQSIRMRFSVHTTGRTSSPVRPI
jgi:hypothetical protein